MRDKNTSKNRIWKAFLIGAAILALIFALLAYLKKPPQFDVRVDSRAGFEFAGELKDANGVCLPDGDYEVAFRVFDQEFGGWPLWQEQQLVMLKDCRFETVLGQDGSMDFDLDSGEYYLEVKLLDSESGGKRVSIVTKDGDTKISEDAQNIYNNYYTTTYAGGETLDQVVGNGNSTNAVLLNGQVTLESVPVSLTDKNLNTFPAGERGIFDALNYLQSEITSGGNYQSGMWEDSGEALQPKDKVSQNIDIDSGWLSVSGATTLSSTLSVADEAWFTDKITVSKRVTFGSGSTYYFFPTTRGADGQVLVTDSDGALSWQDQSGGGGGDSLWTDSGTALSPAAGVSANVNIASGNLTVSGASTLSSTLGVSGVSTFASNISVTGTSNFVGAVTYGTGATDYTFPITRGANNQILVTDASGNVTWQNPSGGFTDPMTTAGDVIYRDATNTTTRLGMGSAGQVLQRNGGGTTIEWAALELTDLSDVNSSTPTAGYLMLADGVDWESVQMTGDVAITAGGATSVNSVQPDAVALGTDTTGNYVRSITNGNGITGGDGGSESADLTLALGTMTGNWDTGSGGAIQNVAGMTIAAGSTISSTGALTVQAGAATDLTLGARGGSVTLNEAGDTSLSGFTATSIIGALNELAGGSGAGLWNKTGTVIHPATSTDNVTIGGSSDLAKFGVDGDADEIQLLVQGHSTQNANLVVFENSAGTDLYTMTGAGVATYSGNLNATDGVDVSGGALTFTGTAGSWTMAEADSALTQTGAGQVTFTGNVDASSGVDISGAALTVNNQAITQLTGGQVTFAGNVDAAAGIDITNAALTMGTQNITGVGTNITATGALEVAATGGTNDLTLTGRGAGTTLNEAGDTSLSGFTATSIIGALNELAAGSGAGLWNITGSVIHPATTTDDVAVGGTTLAAAFSVDEDANTVRIGDASDADATLNMYNTDGEHGTLIFDSTDDRFEFTYSDGNADVHTTGSFISGSTITINGVANTITGSSALAMTSTSGNLNLQTTTSGNIVLNSDGGTIEAEDNVNATAGLDVTGASLTVDNQAITQTTGGQVTFAGNVDADAGADVTGAALTVTGQAITQTVGQVTLGGNVDASSGVDISGAALTVNNQAITQLTGGQVTFAGNVDAAAGIDITNAALTMGTQNITGVGTNITATGALEVAATGGTNDLTLTGRGAGTTLNEAGDTTLSGFTATSIIGALNELAAGSGSAGLWLDNAGSDYLYPNSTYSNNVSVSSGIMSIGTTPTAGYSLEIANTTNSGRGINISMGGSATGNTYGVYSASTSSSATSNNGFYTTVSGATQANEAFHGLVTFAGYGADLYGSYLSVTTATHVGAGAEKIGTYSYIHGNSWGEGADNTYAIYGYNTTDITPGASAEGHGYGVYGEADLDDDTNVAEFAYGVYGKAAGAETNYGGYFETSYASGTTNYGVYAEANNGANNYAIYAKAYDYAGDDYSGYFDSSDGIEYGVYIAGGATEHELYVGGTGYFSGALTAASTTNLIGAVTFGTGGTSYVLPTARGTNGQMLVTDGSGNVSWSSSSSALNIPISNLTAATAANSINNGAYTQTWQWNSMTTGSGLALSSNSATSGHLLDLSISGSIAANGQTALRIGTTGVNPLASISTYGIEVVNTHGGTSAINYGIKSTAGKSTTSYGVYGAASQNSTGYGLYGDVNTVSAGGAGYAVYGEADTGDGTYGHGGYFSALSDGGTPLRNYGAYAEAAGAASSTFGIYAKVLGDGGDSYAGYFDANSVADYGVYVDGGSTDALYVNGTATVSSTSNLVGVVTMGTGGTSYDLPNTRGTNGQMLVTDGSGNVTWSSSSSALNIPISNLTAATATNDINNAAYAQVWGWDSLTTGTGLALDANALTSGTLLSLSSTSTADLTGQTILSVSSSGRADSQTTYGVDISNANYGSGTTVYGLRSVVTGGETAYGVYGSATGSNPDTTYGIYGTSEDSGGTNYAGYFDGSSADVEYGVYINGGSTDALYVAGTASVVDTTNEDIAMVHADNASFSNTVLTLASDEEDTGSFYFIEAIEDYDTSADVKFSVDQDGTVVSGSTITINGSANTIQSSAAATFSTAAGLFTLRGAAGVTVDANGGNLTLDAATGNDVAVTLGGAAGDDFTVDSSVLVVESDTNRVGINNAAPTVALDVVGSTLISTNLTANGTITFPGVRETVSEDDPVYIDKNGILGLRPSALRFKQNVVDMENVNWLYDLQPRNFELKTRPGVKKYGLIAEEVENVNEAFVVYDDEGNITSVRYEDLVTPLLKAVQEHEEQLTNLRVGAGGEGTIESGDLVGDLGITGNLAVAGDVDISGTLKVSSIWSQNATWHIDSQGELFVQNIQTQDIEIADGDNKAVGSGILPAGETEVVVENTSVTENSYIMITIGAYAKAEAQAAISDNLKVKQIDGGRQFIVSTTDNQPAAEDIPFGYLIIN